MFFTNHREPQAMSLPSSGSDAKSSQNPTGHAEAVPSLNAGAVVGEFQTEVWRKDLALTGCMTVVCNWYHAEKIIGSKPCIPAMDGERSHGMCLECARRFAGENGLQ